MKEQVTVVIPSYNPGEYLREAISTVFEQSYENWKLIIVDDASTDNSLKSIEDYLQDPRVTLIINPINLGQSKCMNIALQFVDTNFFMQLDSDDWLLPDTLEVLMKESKVISENVALIIGNVEEVYENRVGPKRKQIIRRPDWGKGYKNRYEILLANLFPWQKFYRTSAIRKIGGWPIYDIYQGRHGEDLFIFLRLVEDYSFHWLDRVIYKYRRHATNTINQIELYHEVVKMIIQDALNRWGNEYEPIFKIVEPEGYVILDSLIPKK